MSEEHEWVRRLLAEAGEHPEPMPPEVASRLDDVVARLAGDMPAQDDGRRTEVPGPAPVVPMTRSRHRRWAGAVLAAAAVTVGGYSLAATGLLGGVTGAEDGGAGDAVTADREPESDTGSADGGTAETRTAAPGTTASTDVTALASATLRADARRLVTAVVPPRDATAESDGLAAGEPAAPRLGAGCVPPPEAVRGVREPVTLDARPATAVVLARADGTTLVQVWSCQDRRRLARVVVTR